MRVRETECSEWIIAAFQNHQKRKENKNCSRDTIRRQRFILSLWPFLFGLFFFMKLPRSRVGSRIDQSVLFLH